MAGIKLANGTAASAEMTVDTNGNAHVVLPTTDTQAGFAAMVSEVDSGLVTGSRYMKAAEVSEDFRLRCGMDSVLFHHSFEGTNVARDRIQQNDSTMTAAQTNGALTINSAAVTASGNNCNIRTYRTFPLFGSFMTYAEAWVQLANHTATNSVAEWGLGYCTGATAQLTDGLIFRVLGGGQLQAVVINNSVDVSATNVTTTNIPSRDGTGSFDITETNHYVIGTHNDEVQFWINDTLVAEVKTISTSGAATSASSQPLMGRVYNSGVASAGKQVIFRFLGVNQGELNASKPWAHQVAGFGGGAYQIQPGTASGPTVTRGTGANGWPASATARAAGTWTATSAPALNSLGGMYLTPAISTLTSDADYPVFAYLNPAGTATLPGKTLYITNIRVGESIATVAASTNGITLMHIVGVGSTGSGTAVSDAAATVGARGIVVGSHGFGASAAVGDMRSGYEVTFDTPLVVPPGTYFHFIVRPLGTVASNTLVVSGSVAVVGYFE